MKVVIAIDKFKGSATQTQLSKTIATAFHKQLPQAQVVIVPIADGGDGTTQAIKQILGDKVTPCSCEVHFTQSIQGSRLRKVEYLFAPNSATAYMDIATTDGLALIPANERHVMNYGTIATGEMIRHAINHGAKHIVLGLGGSATCDGGIGILDALGCDLLDKNQQRLRACASNLNRINSIVHDCMDKLVDGVTFTLLTDVSNPLLGNNGAAAIFAPQKGATPLEVRQLEEGLANLARFMPDCASLIPGAGAAGGVAATMAGFLNASIKHGIDWILDLAHFDDIISDASLVITGEGRIDNQTMMGKAPAGVMKAARRHTVPVVALCGSLAPGTDTASMGFERVIEVTRKDMSLEQAMETSTTLSQVEKATLSLISIWNWK